MLRFFAQELMKLAGAGNNLNPDVKLRPHQEEAVNKVIATNGNLLLSHPVGSGKCLRGETPVLTNKGLVPIADLFGDLREGPEAELLILPEPDLLVLSYVSGQYKWQKIKALYRQRLPEDEATVIVETKRGDWLDATRAHPLPVVYCAQIDWAPSATLKDGDFLCLPDRIIPPPETVDIPDDLLVLLSWQIAEGWEDHRKNTTIITQDNVAVLEDLQQRFRRLFPESSSGRVAPARVDKKGKRRSPYIAICCAQYRKRLEDLGYSWGHKSREKAFPSWLLALSDGKLRQILRAFFDAEGSATSGNVELTSASHTLIYQVQYALLRFGVRAAVHSRQGRATNGSQEYRTYWRLSFSGEDAEHFLSNVGFSAPYKQQALVTCVEKNRNPNFGIPVLGVLDAMEAIGLTRESMQVTRGKTLQTMAKESCLQLVARLRYLASRMGVEHYGQQVAALNGTAQVYSQRTFSSIKGNSLFLRNCAYHLEKLAGQPLRFAPIHVCEGETGGFVYDLSVDADSYEDRNYIAGFGALLVHNTITAIAAFERLREKGMAHRALVVTPASLRSNFVDNGVHRFTKSRAAVFGNSQEVAAGQGLPVDRPDPKADYHVISYEMFRSNPEAYIKASGADTLVFDELHKIKNVGVTGEEIKKTRPLYRNFIGLTGSIVSNTPADLVPLVDAMTNGNHKLGTKDNFERRFMDESGQKLRNTTIMRILLNPYIHHVEPTPALAAPKKVTEVVKVDMSPEQQELYQFVMDKMDPITAAKFRFGTSKLKTNEVQNIFNKMTQARQVANAVHTINQSVSLSDSAVRSPKIKHALDDVEEHLKETPDGQAIMYSNMIHGGVDVTSQGLKDRGIPFGVFIGKGQPGSTEKSRQQAVLDYKSGKSKVLLISSAGGEGLDLGNTTFVATLDGHFNPEKTLQAEARGIRSGGQAARPPEKRQVIVRRYVTSIPRSYSQTALNVMGLTSLSGALERMQKGAPILYNPFKKERSPDEWAYEVAENKAKRNTQLKSFLDKHGSAESECLEDLLDEMERVLEAQSEPDFFPAVKIAAMSEREKAKEHRFAAQRIPFQPNKLVKSDVHIMDSYLKKFGPELENKLDVGAPLAKEEDRIEEQKHIDALRKYYVEAARGMGIKPGASDMDVYKEIAATGLLAGPAVGGMTFGPAIAQSLAMGNTRGALRYTGLGMGLGAALIGGAAIPLAWTPRFTTPKVKAKRMSRLSDNELRQVLRGLQVEQKEEKVSKYFIGGKKG